MLLSTAFLSVPHVDTGDSLLEDGTRDMDNGENERGRHEADRGRHEAELWMKT
ncbi:hypothetical protein T4E_5752 [Trichinella pseudospiralis]|uniref:Uncharacterized protein n=1 Tax=Trichinella pseudospiralis TaxID=6337 RepID=A0A0V0YAY4_TRIPS|nr:hypothetical protein T4E_5752 [Trichinella pseudospiralis]